MINLNRILIPTDFSELSAHALQYASDLARTYRAELHVLHVVATAHEVPAAVGGGADVGMGNVGAVLMESAANLVSRKTQELRTHIAEISGELPVEPVALVRTGVPWNEIVRYADEVAIDLIVIGSHARGIMKRILLGSTSKSVLEHAACPVLMVPIAVLQGDSAGKTEDSEASAKA